MQAGQTFVVDAQAVKEVAELLKVAESDLAGKVTAGDTYGISKKEKCEGDVIRASKHEADDSGELKAKKGRPRRFPRKTVARLLGETDDRSLTAPSEEEVAAADEANAEADLEAHAAAVLADAPAAATADASDDASW